MAPDKGRSKFVQQNDDTNAQIYSLASTLYQALISQNNNLEECARKALEVATKVVMEGRENSTSAGGSDK
jgi:hypothetical protein